MCSGKGKQVGCSAPAGRARHSTGEVVQRAIGWVLHQCARMHHGGEGPRTGTVGCCKPCCVTYTPCLPAPSRRLNACNMLFVVLFTHRITVMVGRAPA